MKISPHEIEEQRFAKKLRGYAPEEVQAFLRVVAAEVQRLNLEREDLRGELGRLREELAGTRKSEQTLQRAIASAERIAEQVRTEGQREAESLLGEARARSERMIETAQKELADLESEVSRLRIERETFENRLRLAIDEHRRLLELRQERTTRSETLKLFQRPSSAGAEE